MQKKTYLIVFFIFLFINLFLVSVQSAPPVTQVQQFTTGYSIKYPENLVIQVNQTEKFNFHVYNISDGMPIISNAQCYFHLYNMTGQHILRMTTSTVNDDFDYEFLVLGGNFSKVGDYSFVLQCNNSAAQLGGFIEQPLLVNLTGDETQNQSNILFFIFLLIAIIMLVFGYYKKEYMFIMFSGVMFIVAGVSLFMGQLPYMSSLLNQVLCLVLWGVGAYLLIRTSFEITNLD